jgi:hypothetical protein
MALGWHGFYKYFYCLYSERMNKKIHKALFYTLILGVYGIFFSVESFYNFEGQPNGKESLRYVVNFSSAPYSQTVVKKSPLQSSASHGFRLNKRFHQENIPPCPIFSLAAPERNIAPLRLGFCGTRTLPTVAIVHYSLRGPPTIA